MHSEKERFIENCIEAGVDGIIVPDLPYEEQNIIAPLLREVNIALIPLVTVTSPIERIEKITSESEGFVYAVTVAGVTGVRQNFKEEIHSYLEKVKITRQLTSSRWIRHLNKKNM